MRAKQLTVSSTKRNFHVTIVTVRGRGVGEPGKRLGRGRFLRGDFAWNVLLFRRAWVSKLASRVEQGSTEASSSQSSPEPHLLLDRAGIPLTSRASGAPPTQAGPPDRPKLRRYAGLGLVALAFMLLGGQFAAVAAYYPLNTELSQGTDVATQWHAYIAQNVVPEVLFVGDSQTELDIDTSEIANLLSKSAGRRIEVGKISARAEGPDFLEALTYRVMSLPRHPRLIVFPLNPVTSNAFHENGWDPTSDLFQLSDPIDAGYMRLAVTVDASRGALLRDWLVPYFRTTPTISTALKCRAVRWLEGHLPKVPGELRAVCDELAHTLATTTFDYKTKETVIGQYRQWLPDYRMSSREAAHIRSSVQLIRSGGSEILFMVYPSRDVIEDRASAYAKFERAAGELSVSLNVPMISLLHAVAMDDALWADPVHLNRWGAKAVAPAVMTALMGTPLVRAALDK